jgi:hypothetical protein
MTMPHIIRAGSDLFPDDGASIGFLTDPPIRPWRKESGWWEVCDTLIWRRETGVLDVVPDGFRCNLASIPRPLWIADHPAATWLVRGSVMHDWQCGALDPRGHAAVHRQWQQMVTWDAETWLQRHLKAPAYGTTVRLFGPRWEGTA